MAVLHTHHHGSKDGAPLLAIHGITAHGRRFNDLCAEYLTHRYVVAVDLRGHGASLCDSPWNLETHVDDIIDTLDSLGWGQVDVMGHSLGGNLAARLLAAHPDRVKRVALLDPAFALPTALTTGLATAALEDKAFESLDAMVAADRLTRPAAAHIGAEADIRSNAFQGEDGKWRMPYHRAPVVGMWGELSRELPPIPQSRPTLLINALQAKLVLEPQITYLETQLEADLVQVDLDLGHMIYWEDLTATGRVVAGFFATES
jgi:lipase